MIRNATSKDYPRLLAIQIACIQGLADTYADHDIKTWVAYLRQEGADRYAGYKTRVFVDTKGEIAGFISWSQPLLSDEAAIECLYVLKQHRGEGIGRVLLREAESNIPMSTVIHVRSTLNAEPFYEKHGYAFVENAVSRAGFAIRLLTKKLG